MADKLYNIKCLSIIGHIGSAKYINEDWGIVAYRIPRSEIYEQFAEKELGYNSIYFLIGNNNGDRIYKAYVGQALERDNGDSVIARAKQHDKAVLESYHDNWNWVVAFTNEKKTWGATELNALESAFIKLLPKNICQNRRNQNSGGANYADSKYENKIEYIIKYIKAMGFDIFDSLQDKDRLYSDIQITDKRDGRKTEEISDKLDSKKVEFLNERKARIPEVVTPHKVVKEMVDMLPENVWNDKTIFFDMACKGGEYLKEIYDRLMENEGMKLKYPEIIKRSNYILKEQIFGVALSELSLERTSISLGGFDFNIKIIDGYINKLKKAWMKSKNSSAKKEVRKILNEAFGREMNIDVVIGNPPYQEMTNSGSQGSGAMALFDKFISAGIDASNRIVCMVTPTKWIAGTQSNMAFIRDKLTSKNNIKYMVDYMNGRDCFPNTQIAGGISYFLYDREYEGSVEFTTVLGEKYTRKRKFGTYNIIPRHAMADSIISKIRKIDKTSIQENIARDRWGFGTDFREASSIRNADTDIRLITSKGDYYLKDEGAFVSGLNKYQVMFTRVVDGGFVNGSRDNNYKLLSSLDILKPGEICNASYMIMGDFETEDLALNGLKYLKTKFVRFLLLQTLFGIGLTADRFQFVPYQDFTQNSDIDWLEDIGDIDRQLYRKYGLSLEEYGFIEKVIKTMY